MNDILKKLNIDETFTKETKKQKVFNNIRKNTYPKEDYNMMADLLELPKTKKGFRYLFVIVDLFSREFDIEPIRNKDSETVLKAMMKCFKRKHINSPYASLRTDSGKEFKGVFHKYLFDKNILHKIALPNRHKQLATVESLNKQLGRLFNGYMNSKEKETEEEYNEWTDVVDTVRTELNKFRKNLKVEEPGYFNPEKPPKFKVGDMVYEKLDWAENALGNKQPTPNFRQGDFRYSQIPKKITEVLYFNDKPYYRYMIEGIKNASFSEFELIASKEKETKFKVKKIIGKRKNKNKIEYLIWFDKQLKKNAVWLPKKQLLEDGLGKEIKAYDKDN